jgi:hypothetical protein
MPQNGLASSWAALLLEQKGAVRLEWVEINIFARDLQKALGIIAAAPLGLAHPNPISRPITSAFKASSFYEGL